MVVKKYIVYSFLLVFIPIFLLWNVSLARENKLKIEKLSKQLIDCQNATNDKSSSFVTANISNIVDGHPPVEMYKDWPTDNFGILYAKIEPPGLLGSLYTKWYRVDVFGQLCDGTDHKDFVHLMLYNSFPDHGKGYTYLEWECVPDNPLQCKYPRTGKVKLVKPYNGIADY